MTLNRVVVTGYGVTSPIGNTPEEFWESLKSGKIGIGPLTKFDTSEYNVHIAAEIKDFPFDKYFVKKDNNRYDPYSLYALYAAHEAVANAVKTASALNIDLAELSLQQLQELIPEIDDTVFEVLTLEGSVAARQHPGGTSTEQVRQQIASWRQRLSKNG